MIGKERETKLTLSEEDQPVEWPAEVFERAQISVGRKVVREATGTLTRRGRPRVGDELKQAEVAGPGGSCGGINSK